MKNGSSDHWGMGEGDDGRECECDADSSAAEVRSIGV
jgi:hypothetical protein